LGRGGRTTPRRSRRESRVPRPSPASAAGSRCPTGPGAARTRAPTAGRSILSATAPTEPRDRDDRARPRVPILRPASSPGYRMLLNRAALALATLALLVTAPAGAQSLSGVLQDSLLYDGPLPNATIRIEGLQRRPGPTCSGGFASTAWPPAPTG